MLRALREFLRRANEKTKGTQDVPKWKGRRFFDHVDSGTAILSTTGEVIGLLYAGNGMQTYACPIQAVLSALNCTLA